MSQSKRQVIRHTSVVLVGLLLITGYVTVTWHPASKASGSHHQHIAILPAAAMEAAPAPLPRAGWTVSASDEETTGENGRAINVLDGNAGTHWHSKWTAPAVPLPHTITIDTKMTQSISGFRYLPRASGANGRDRKSVV